LDPRPSDPSFALYVSSLASPEKRCDTNRAKRCVTQHVKCRGFVLRSIYDTLFYAAKTRWVVPRKGKKTAAVPIEPFRKISLGSGPAIKDGKIRAWLLILDLYSPAPLDNQVSGRANFCRLAPRRKDS
jgi:hypothetical protein